METEWSSSYGDEPWDAAQPPYLGQRRSRVSSVLALIAVVAGVAGLGVALYGVATQLLPRRFTAAQQRQITNWEYGERWRALSAGAIFPATIRYAPPAVLEDDPALTLDSRRIGIARQASCRVAADPAAAAILDRNGCTAMLRATYVNASDSYVVTVGAAVLPGTAQAAAAAAELAGTDDTGRIAPGVLTMPFKNTPAEWFTNQRRQISGSMAAGAYVILYTVGYADPRPREPVAGDSYADAELTDAGEGVARAVLFTLGRPVPAPRCPGTPGC